MNKIRLTYFTPTYNRETLLPKLYKSLVSQTNKSFIWLIIDDGSTDNTEQLIKNWQTENKIHIKYIKKENGGKHTAIELSNEVCETEYITCIDSDDTLTKEATNIFYSKFDLCKDNNVAGLLGPKTIINDKFKTNWQTDGEKIYFYDLDKILGNIPETTLVFKTDIAKQFHFPVFEDEKFVTESVYYKQFFYDYKFITFKDEVYIAEYQDDGYTNMGMRLFINNPKGYACALKQTAYLSIQKKQSLKTKIKQVIIYYGWKSLFKIKIDVMPEYKIPWFYSILGFLTIPISKQKLKNKYKEDLKKYYQNKK